MNMSNSSIWPIERKDPSTHGQSGRGINSNEQVLHISHSSHYQIV